jgi:hypothetical protein
MPEEQRPMTFVESIRLVVESMGESEAAPLQGNVDLSGVAAVRMLFVMMHYLVLLEGAASKVRDPSAALAVQTMRERVTCSIRDLELAIQAAK